MILIISRLRKSGVKILKKYDCEKCVHFDFFSYICLAEDCHDGSEYVPEFPDLDAQHDAMRELAEELIKRCSQCVYSTEDGDCRLMDCIYREW